MTASGVRLSAARRGVSRRRPRTPLGWLARVAARRARTQWRLLAVVGVVALLVSTLVATLTLLLVTTEDAAVRDTLADAPASRTEVTLRVDAPRVSVAELRAAADASIGRLLGADVVSDDQVVSEVGYVPRDGRSDALGYLAEYDGIRANAELVDGAWPGDVVLPGGALPIAVPEAGLDALGIDGVGDALRLASLDDRDEPVDLQVVGVFRAVNPAARFWSTDRLGGAGLAESYPVPGTAMLYRTDAVGPLVVAPDGLDATTAPLGGALLRYVPDVRTADVADLAALQGRLAVAPTDIPRELVNTGRSVSLVTDLDAFVREVTTAVLVTRAGVTVAGLLLLLLAVAALLQTARLLADARSVEHDLMRARGAANRQVLDVAAVEAAGVVVLTAVAGPLLAPWAYRALLAARGLDLAGAGPPTVPLLTWVTGLVVGLGLAAVLVGPLLRAPDTFVEGQQARGRDRRAMLARSGFDVLVVALAAVAYWQLQAYRSPLTGSGASAGLDPVLIAGPAVALLAGALLCVRLLPPAARVLERLAARGRGLVGPLAAWEVGRRSSRATAAVLLLTLAIAVSTYSQTFLATWHRSQADQAEFASGAPVRVLDDPAATGRQVAALASDVAGPAQPVLRVPSVEGTLGPYSAAAEFGDRGGFVAGRPVEVLGLTPEARAMLDRGRMGDEAGGVVAAMESPELSAVDGIDLGEDVAGLSLAFEVRSRGAALSSSGASLRVVLQDGAGVYSVVDVGFAFVDGGAQRFDVLLDGAPAAPADGEADPAADADAAADPAGARAYPLRLVGATVTVGAARSGGVLETVVGGAAERYDLEVLLTEVAALRPGAPPEDAPTAAELLETWDGTGPRPTDPPPGLVRDPVEAATATWSRSGVNTQVGSLAEPPDDGLGLRLIGAPADLTFAPAQVTSLAWLPRTPSPAVITSGVADRLDAEVGSRLLVGVPGARQIVDVVGVVDRLPTTRARDAVVVDHAALARTIAEATVLGTTVDEWWVDVPPEHVETYLADLPPSADGRPAADRVTAMARETAALQSGPLRVAVPVALWLVTAGAALIAGVGFAVHAAVTLRSRRTELAQLRAVGLQRRRVVGVVALESLLLWVLGVVFGTAVGVALGWLVGPLVAVSADGAPPVPPVVVHVPWQPVLAVVGGLGVLVAVVVVLVARGQRAADPAAVLREEGAR